MPINKDLDPAILKATLAPADVHIAMQQVLKAGTLSPEQQLLVLKIVEEDAALLKQLGR